MIDATPDSTLTVPGTQLEATLVIPGPHEVTL